MHGVHYIRGKGKHRESSEEECKKGDGEGNEENESFN